MALINKHDEIWIAYSLEGAPTLFIGTFVDRVSEHIRFFNLR